MYPHRHCHYNLQNRKKQGIHQDSYEDDEYVRHHRTRWVAAWKRFTLMTKWGRQLSFRNSITIIYVKLSTQKIKLCLVARQEQLPLYTIDIWRRVQQT